MSVREELEAKYGKPVQSTQPTTGSVRAMLEAKYKAPETRESRIEKGLPVSTESRFNRTGQITPSAGGNFAREVLKTPARIGASISSIGKGVKELSKGNMADSSVMNQPMQSNYFGNVDPIGTRDGQRLSAGQELKDTVGAGLDAASFIPVGTGAKLAVQVAKQPFKQALKTTAKAFGKEGLIQGGLSSAGRSMQDGDTFGDTLGKTAVGTVVGGLAGAGIGAVTQGVSRAISKTPVEFVNKKVDDNIRKAFDGTTADLQTLEKNAVHAKRGLGRLINEDIEIPDTNAPIGSGITKKFDLIKSKPNEFISAIEAQRNKIAQIGRSSAEEASSAGRQIDTKNAQNIIIQAVNTGEIPKATGERFLRQIQTLQNDPLKVHEWVQDVNVKYANRFNKGTINDTIQSRIANNIADTLREQLDKNVYRGEYAQAYGDNQALKKLIVAVAKKANKKVNFGDITSDAGLDAAISVLTGNPAYMARTLADGVFKGIVRNIRNQSGFKAIKKAGQGVDAVAMPTQGVRPQFRLPTHSSELNTQITGASTKQVTIPKKLQSVANERSQIITKKFPNETEAMLDFNSKTKNQQQFILDVLNVKTKTEYLKRVVKREGGQEAFGAIAGIEKDEEGNIKFNPEKAALGLGVIGSIKSKAGQKALGKVGDAIKKNVDAYKGEKDLTTKILKDLEGKKTVSKQYILDATNRPELKQVERDLIRRILNDMDNLPQEYKKLDWDKIPEGGVKTTIPLNKLRVTSSALEKATNNVKKGEGSRTSGLIDVAMLKDGTFAISEGHHRGVQKMLQGDTSIEALVHSTKHSASPDSVYNSLDTTFSKSKSSDTINVSDFAKKVKAELLPLKVLDSKSKVGYGTRGTRYENISLPDELKGSVKNYEERVYQSPIQTSAGKVHFGDSTKNYFGHTRIEDMADNQTRRVLEVQSDLYQKGNLENEVKNRLNSEGQIDPRSYVKMMKESGYEAKQIADWEKKIPEFDKAVEKAKSETAKLQQYNDPTAHFRLIREEIKKASEDGKPKLQFPTGETAMKIEGLGDNQTWIFKETKDTLTTGDISVGAEIEQGAGGQSWIITDVLGDGKFKAVPKKVSTNAVGMEAKRGESGMVDFADFSKEQQKKIADSLSEEFDISGKVDTNNPIYKFYEKDVQKYLNKFGGQRVKDAQGVEWIEVPIKKEWAKMPVEAFAFAPIILLPKSKEKKKSKLPKNKQR